MEACPGLDPSWDVVVEFRTESSVVHSKEKDPIGIIFKPHFETMAARLKTRWWIAISERDGK
jgi:hypothetical protein